MLLCPAGFEFGLKNDAGAAVSPEFEHELERLCTVPEETVSSVVRRKTSSDSIRSKEDRLKRAEV